MTFKLELSERDVQIVGTALSRLPYADVAATINALQAQINAQVEQKTTVKVDEAA